MHFTFGVRLSSEDEKLGMDIHGHGEGWNRHTKTSTNRVSVPNNRPSTPGNQVNIPTIHVSAPINEVTPVNEIPPPVDNPVPRRFRRHSVRDILQEAFT